MQLPFEVSNLGHLSSKGRGLGFGTYLAYFSRILANPAWSNHENMFLMNKEMTEEEKEIRQYMNLVLSNLIQEKQLANISIWELAKYLHANADEPNSFEFSTPLTEDFGCKSYYFILAWEYYSKAYFAD